MKGPCKGCGAEDYSLSYGGPDVCPACDCYGLCPRCKIVIEENKCLRVQLQQCKDEHGNTIK